MHYQQFAFNAYCGAVGSVYKMAPQQAQASEMLVAHEKLGQFTANGVRFTHVKWEIYFLLIFETAPFICKHPV